MRDDRDVHNVADANVFRSRRPYARENPARQEAAMRLTVLLATVLCLLLAASASAHRGAQGWTEAKAERAAKREATVRLPRSLDARVQEELWTLVARYRALEQFAYDEGDDQAAAIIHNLRYRYSTALKRVEEGLEIAVAGCDGTGAAVTGNRFRHFRCSVTSKRLEIPTAELVYPDEDSLPEIVDGEPRSYGPYDASLLLHATGTSSIAFRQLGDARAS
jgi:hypothetical protein